MRTYDAPVPTARAPLSRPLSILLAEDDHEMRELLAWSLQRKGYNVVQCGDGTTLMKKLGMLDASEPGGFYDLIISDIRMPGVDGLEVLSRAHAFPDAPPMILITAFPDEESRNQAQQLGAIAVIAKPFDIDEMLEKVIDTIPPDLVRRRRARFAARNVTHVPPFPLEITLRHSSGATSIREYAAEAASRLSPIAEHISSCRVVIEEFDPQDRRKHRYVVTVVLATAGRPVVVHYNSDTGGGPDSLPAAVNMAFSGASRELKRRIGRGRPRKRSPRSKRRPATWTVPDEEGSPE